MKSYLFGAVSVLSLVAAGSASANDDDGWYLRGNAGYGIHHDAELTGGIDSSLHGNGLQSEGNLGYTAGVGYEFGNNWRVELDVDSLKTSLGAISQTPNSSGKVKTESLMLNALYDFDSLGKLEPYIGAGLGYVQGKGEFSATDFAGTANELVINPTCIGTRTSSAGLTCGISSSDSGFGWQLLAGLGYLDLQGHVANVNTGAFSDFDAELGDVGAHTLMTGLRYKFGKSNTAPKVITPPAPVATYECWDTETSAGGYPRAGCPNANLLGWLYSGRLCDLSCTAANLFLLGWIHYL